MISLSIFFVLVSSAVAIIPFDYDITITPDISVESDLKFTGALELSVEIAEPTTLIELDAKNLQIEEVTIKDGDVEVEGVTSEPVGEKLSITIAEELSAGLYKIKIVYTGKINEEAEGVYLKKIGEQNVILTNLHGGKAKQVLPCFDNPNIVANFKLKIDLQNLEETFIALSNTPVASEEAHVLTFATANAIPPYLFSFALLQSFVEFKLEGTRVFSRDNKSVEFLAELSRDFIAQLNEESEKISEISQIVVPDDCLPQAVLENLGLIIYRESAVLFDEGREDSEEKQEVAKNVALTIARQQHLQNENSLLDWAKEGSSWSKYVEIVDKLQADWGLKTQIYTQVLTDALEEDAQNPVSLTGNDYTELQRVKAYALVRMFEKLQTPGDILENAEHSVGKSWTQFPGHPLLTSTKNGDVIAFTRFVNGVNTRPTPINILFDNSEDSEDLSYAVTITSALVRPSFDPFAWYLVNSKRIGFFRNRYSEQDWKTLAEVLLASTTSLSVENRANLIADSFSFSQSDNLNVTLYLEMVKFLEKENERVPFITFVKTAERMRALLAGTSAEARFEKFAVGLVDRLYSDIGDGLRAGDSHVDRLARKKVLTWLCGFGHDQCQKDQNAELGKGNEVAPDLQELVYCGGMRLGDLQTFGFIKDQYDLYKKKRILKSLGCTSDKQILNQLITAIIDSTVLKFDREHLVDVFLAVLEGSTSGVDVALAFAKQYLEQLLEIFQESEITQIFTVLSTRLVTAEQNQTIADIIDCLTEEQKTQYQQLFATVVKNIGDNIKWREENVGAVLAWLNEVAPTEPPVTDPPVTTPSVTNPPVTEPNATTTTKAPDGGNGAGAVVISSACLVLYAVVHLVLLYN